MQRQRLRREHPEWSDAELAGAMRAWMRDRPGAEHGDAIGTPSNRLR
jgi:Rv0078B-related antitoxin